MTTCLKKDYCKVWNILSTEDCNDTHRFTQKYMATPQYLPLDSTDFQKFLNNNILYDLLEHDIKGFQKKIKSNKYS